MKKIICTLLAISMFMTITACSSTKPVSPKNAIAPAELTAEQQKILDLLSVPNDQEMMIFDFSTEESYRSFEVWVEVYQDGEVIDRPAGVNIRSGTAQKLNGYLAVIISISDNNYQWTLSVIENGAKSSHIGATQIDIGSGFGRAYGPMNGSVNIEDGKEIIIYSSTFQEANVPHAAYDEQTLMERPELLNDYPYAFLIKCKFSN